MLEVVIDTNIVISAALSPKGKPAKIINLIADNNGIQIYYSSGILAEYKEVLSRSHFNIAAHIQLNIVNAIEENVSG